MGSIGPMSYPSAISPHQTPAASWVSPEVRTAAMFEGSKPLGIFHGEKDFQAIQENNTNKQKNQKPAKKQKEANIFF